MSLITKSVLAIAVLAVVGALIFTTVCPCERTPGAYLFGTEATEAVADWSFANDEPLCQIEVTTWRPHSVNLNCMSADGELYVSCSSCAGKLWSQTALKTQAGRIRIGDTVYPVTLRRVQDPDELDLAWRTRAAKLKRDPAPRPDHWWSFHLSSST